MSFKSEFVANLPPKPADAIVELADRAQVWMNKPASTADEANATYMLAVFRGFIKRYDLGIEVASGRGATESDLPDYVVAIRRHIDAVTEFYGPIEVDRLLDEYDASRGEEDIGIAVLSKEEKRSIHAHLDGARTIIEDSVLSTRKKNKLFRKLNRLSEDVDKDGTPTDAFFVFAADSAFVIGEMAEKAAPFIAEVKEILNIVGRSRTKAEGVKLPGGRVPLELPYPDDQEHPEE